VLIQRRGQKVVVFAMVNDSFASPDEPTSRSAEPFVAESSRA